MTSNANPAISAATRIAVRVALVFMVRGPNSALTSEADEPARASPRTTLISSSIMGTSACQATSRAVQRCVA